MKIGSLIKHKLTNQFGIITYCDIGNDDCYVIWLNHPHFLCTESISHTYSYIKWSYDVISE